MAIRRGSNRFAGSLLMLLFISALPALATERTVDLAAPDGTLLKGTYFSAGKPGPGVLLLHQCNRDRKVWDALAEQLSAAGLNVLTIDYRGFGESGGEPERKLTPQQIGAQRAKWPNDLEAAYKYLVSQPDVNKDVIGVGGASCGVDNSLQLAVRHPEVQSLVLLSGLCNRVGRQYLRDTTSPPAFFAAADDDEFPGTVIMIEWQYNIAGNPGKEYVHEKTGNHGTDMFVAHPKLMKQITQWYVTTLITTPGHAPVLKSNFKPSEEVRVLSMIDQPGGAAKVEQILEEARKKDSKANVFPEPIVNLIGYELLQAGKNQDAVEVMKLNVKAYPNSPNTYDSLADAYLATGQKDLARQASNKALELLPSDNTDPPAQRDAIKASSEGRLKQLGDAPQ